MSRHVYKHPDGPMTHINVGFRPEGEDRMRATLNGPGGIGISNLELVLNWDEGY